MTIRKLAAIAALATTLSIAAAAAAQASVVRWWVKPPAGYGELTPGTPETLNSAAKLIITQNTGALGKCVFKDIETIENPLSATASGVDDMTLFVGSCKRYPWPCTTTETASAVGTGLPWPSVLTEPALGIFADSFSGVSIEFKCSGSGASAVYTASLFEPEVLPNNLKFTFANNKLKSGVHEISFSGNDKVKPLILKKVEAK